MEQKTIEQVKIFITEYYANNKIVLPSDIKLFSNNFCFFIELVNHWTQILGLVLFKSSFPNTRKYLVKNLVDENLSELTHVETFYNFLLECNYDGTQGTNIEQILIKSKLNPVVIKYKTMIEKFLNENTFSNCVEMLGSIEYAYHLIASDINKFFIDKLNNEPSFHFNLHEILDITHAEELFKSSSNSTITYSNVEFGTKWIIDVISELLK